MALGSKKVISDNRVPIWQTNPQNVQGGFGLDTTGLPAGTVVPAGALMIFDESTRLAKAVKTAKAYEAVGTASATIKINKGSFWHKGFFDFAILTDKKFKEKFNYIHYNPVKKGLVEQPEDYKYSSAMEYRIKYGEVFYE